MSYSKDFDHEGERLRVTAKKTGEDRYLVMVGDRAIELQAIVLPDGRLRIEHDGQRFDAVASRAGNNDLHVRVGDRTYLLAAHVGGGSAAGSVSGNGTIVAPMTGTVLQISATLGEEVKADQTVAVLTAMKMEHKLAAGIDGKVVEILEADGAAVDQGAVILRIEP